MRLDVPSRILKSRHPSGTQLKWTLLQVCNTFSELSGAKKFVSDAEETTALVGLPCCLSYPLLLSHRLTNPLYLSEIAVNNGGAFLP